MSTEGGPEIERQSVVIAYGTRPEAIKLAPLIQRIRRSSTLEGLVVATGQHEAAVKDVERAFGIVPDFELHSLIPGQTLNELLARIIIKMDQVLAGVVPRVAVVQGDTTSTLASGLALYHRGVSLVHLEAGLRTWRLKDPFPEEANRRIVSHMSDLHLSPSAQARENLVREGIPEGSIVVTGNTGIEAMRWAQSAHPQAELHPKELSILVTLHRRENWPMIGLVARAIARVAQAMPRVKITIVAHVNPALHRLWVAGVAGLENIHVRPPMEYLAFIHILMDAVLVVTDSGGVQEEASHLGIETIVLRSSTERMESIDAGICRLVALDEDAIVRELNASLTKSSQPREAPFSYGDGESSLRALSAIEAHLGVGQRMPDFISNESQVGTGTRLLPSAADPCT